MTMTKDEAEEVIKEYLGERDTIDDELDEIPDEFASAEDKQKALGKLISICERMAESVETIKEAVDTVHGPGTYDGFFSCGREL